MEWCVCASRVIKLWCICYPYVYVWFTAYPNFQRRHSLQSINTIIIFFLFLARIFSFFVVCFALSIYFPSLTLCWGSFPLSLSRRIYFKRRVDDKFYAIETKVLWKRFDNLEPNTQYVFYVVAASGRNNEISLPSEKVIVWTDPALAAIVDVRIHHLLIIMIKRSGLWVQEKGTMFMRLQRRYWLSIKGKNISW